MFYRTLVLKHCFSTGLTQTPQGDLPSFYFKHIPNSRKRCSLYNKKNRFVNMLFQAYLKAYFQAYFKHFQAYFQASSHFPLVETGTYPPADYTLMI